MFKMHFIAVRTEVDVTVHIQCEVSGEWFTNSTFHWFSLFSLLS